MLTRLKWLCEGCSGSGISNDVNRIWAVRNWLTHFVLGAVCREWWVALGMALGGIVHAFGKNIIATINLATHPECTGDVQGS